MISLQEIKKWKFLPFEKLLFSCSLDANEVLQSLNFKIERTKDLGTSFRQSFKDYKGYITDNKFKIRRIAKIGYNGFLPIAEGTVSDKIGNTEILVTIKFDNFQTTLFAFGIVFMLFPLFFGAIFISSIIVSIIVYAVIIAYFNVEASIIKQDLKYYFNTEQIENNNGKKHLPTQK